MEFKNISGDKCAQTLMIFCKFYGHNVSSKELMSIRTLMEAKSSFLVHVGVAGVDITIVNAKQPRLYENVKQRVKCGCVLFFQGHKMTKLTPENVALNRGYFSGQLPTFQTPGAVEKVRHERPKRGAYEEAATSRPQRRRCTGGGFYKTLHANTVQNDMKPGVY